MIGGNRYQFVDREHIHGSIGGVDFGYNVSCIARSPEWALIWSAGTMYASGAYGQSYRSSQLSIVPRLAARQGSVHMWKSIGEAGGRLRGERISDNAVQLGEFFDEETISAIVNAVRWRKTLLIEGGGNAFTAKPIRHRR